MMLITAALKEEVDIVLRLCHRQRRASAGNSSLWVVEWAGIELHLLKTGMGPARSAERLKQALPFSQPTQILVIGYAGALDPTLRVAELVIGQRAAIFAEGPGKALPLQDLELEGSWELAQSTALLDLACNARIPARIGTVLTSPHIIGEPEQKKVLHRKFKGTAVDMETAALARVGEASGIPVSCIRAVSDEANDTFLAPFSYDPHAGVMDRAAKVVAAGNWIRRCRDWRKRAALARSSLHRFVEAYLQDFASRRVH